MCMQHFKAFHIAITILTLTPGFDTVLVIKHTSRSGLFVHGAFSAIGISAILLQSAQLFE